MSAPQLAFPLTHAGLGTNPFCFTTETLFGVKKTASPTYTAVAITQDVVPTDDGVSIDIRQMGSHQVYGIQNAGKNYGFTIPVHPQNIGFLSYGCNPPNYDTPAGTSAESLQFLIKYKQAQGTAGMSDHYIFFLGCRPDTTTVTISAQALVEASMTWGAREITGASTTSGLVTPTIPTLASITGPVLQDSDGGNKPLTINGIQYAVNNFTITWNNNLIRDAFNGSGLVEALTVGGIEITGSFTTPVGQDLLLETRMADLNQVGVPAVYKVKTGVMFINMTGMLLQSDAQTFEGAPTSTRKHTYTFKCADARIATS
jgi:hypothetical protein